MEYTHRSSRQSYKESRRWRIHSNRGGCDSERGAQFRYPQRVRRGRDTDTARLHGRRDKGAQRHRQIRRESCRGRTQHCRAECDLHCRRGLLAGGVAQIQAAARGEFREPRRHAALRCGGNARRRSGHPQRPAHRGCETQRGEDHAHQSRERPYSLTDGAGTDLRTAGECRHDTRRRGFRHVGQHRSPGLHLQHAGRAGEAPGPRGCAPGRERA